jgi:3-methyl-2-oxobutanoate hydroxymethyltransferase
MNKKLNLNKPLVCLTSYNKFTAEIADEFCDIILVGDSVGMAYYGDQNTRDVSLNEIVRHALSVRKGIKKSLMVVDMPYGTYKNPKIALKNAKLILKKTKCDAIKIEGGSGVSSIIKLLVKNNIKVVGHIGLMPQSIKKTKDYKVKGKTDYEKKQLVHDFIELQKAGVIFVVVEAVKAKVAEELIKIAKIPIIGIGASPNCHGQILVLEDILGMFDRTPKFVKKYANLRQNIKKAIKKYSIDVKQRKFPNKKYTY